MQLIVEADNSDVNIKEKMTTIEESIDILINGVAEIKSTPDKEKGLNLDTENILNGDNVIESETNLKNEDKILLEEVPAPPCDDISEKKSPEEDIVLETNEENINRDVIESQNKIDTEDKIVLEEVLAPPCVELIENKTLEKINVTDTENSLNRDKIIEGQHKVEVLKEVPETVCKVFPQNQIPETEIILNPDITNISNEDFTQSLKNIETEGKAELEDLPASPCKVVSEQEVPEKEKLSNKRKSTNGDVIEIQKDSEIADKIKEASAPPCEDVSETNSTKSNVESHVLLETCEITTKINNNAESHVDISEKTDMTSNTQVKKETKEGFEEKYDDKKNIPKKPSDLKILDHPTQKDSENKLETEDPKEISENKSKKPEEKYDMKQVKSDAESCENKEDQNDVIKQVDEKLFNSTNVDMNDEILTVHNKVENSEALSNKPQESSADINHLKVRDLIPESENFTENTITDMPPIIVSPVVDNTDISTEPSINESTGVKQTDIECNETIVTQETESTLTPMDCDRCNDSDINVKDTTDNLLDHVSSETAIKEDNQIMKNDNLIKHTSTEESKQVENSSTEPKKIQEVDTSISTELPVIEKMDTSEETETVELVMGNEAPEKTAEVKVISSVFNDTKKTMEIEKCMPDALSITDNSCKDVNSDIDEIKIINNEQELSTETAAPSNVTDKPTPVVCKLSNTLNILSDDEDEPPKTQEVQTTSTKPNDKQCINIEDDDDVMVIEDTSHQDKPESNTSDITVDKKEDINCDSNSIDEKITEISKETVPEYNDIKVSDKPQAKLEYSSKSQTSENIAQEPTEEIKKEQPLLPKDLFKSHKKNLTEMTRDDLEEFCILKIVESIIDRSSLNEMKTKLKTMAQTIEEYKKKTMMLTKQNRDLQVVLKSIQEEQKKGGDTPIVPLKITRSVGMQVLMTDKNARRKVNPTPNLGPSPNVSNRPVRSVNLGTTKQLAPVIATNQQIPVPRLVPASNNTAANKNPNTVQVVSNRYTAKPNISMPNGVRSSPPAPKVAEKRSRVQSITVDLTDDEPPPKIQVTKTSPAAPVRLVPSQNLLTPRAQITSNTLTNPRKVYIPIGSNQNQNVRPGQTIMLKNVPNTSGPRPRGAAPMGVRGPTPNQIRMQRVLGRHPAPLPDAVKQYQPPNWKALPPAPDLKLSKVENGIVISWKIDGYQEDSYEEIASYQLYAYQETSVPPNTSLWKKIGDVKALPLPMACTLTQFMAGYKYYFAVRAVDIRSRLGPFSLPGSILLLNKM